MPSVRFSRDKRGYEYVYLVHTPVKRGKPGRTRVLYWYRTPPGVRLGRKPFDDEVQRSLERQYPDLTFDWDTIVSTPMPPPDMTEFWRERRRMEKAARQERRADEAPAGDADSEPAARPSRSGDGRPPVASLPDAADQRDEGFATERLNAEGGDAVDAAGPDPEREPLDPTDRESDSPAPAEAGGATPAGKRRRRRRGGRRPGGNGAETPTGS